MVKLLKYSCLVVILLVAGVFSCLKAQDTPTAFLEGRITTASGKKLAGATITVKKNGSTFKTITTASNGKYEDLELPMGHKYTITVSYDGYLSKTISIDAKSSYYEEDSPSEIPLDIPFELDVVKEGVDYSPISNGFEIGKLAIDPATGGLAPDMSYTSSQKKKYEKFFEDLEKEANKEEEEFKKFVEKGDQAFQAGNYTEAMSNYEQAQNIKSDDPNVATKITNTEKKIEQKQNFDNAVSDGDNALSAKNFDQAIAKYEQAKTIMPEDKTIDKKIEDAKKAKEDAEAAELDAKFQAKMDEANKAFADEDYGYAKTLYQQAGDIKPDEKEPPAKIKECDEMIEKQMAKDQFEQLINDGDAKLGIEDFDGAIARYKEALDTGFDNATANAKIKEAEDAKQAKVAEDAAAAKQEEFNQLIADGDGNLSGEDFDGAIAKYTEALDLGVDDAAAKAKIQEAEDAKQAKEDAEAAEAAKTEFEELIADGDGKLGSEDFDAAIAAYIEALNTGFDNATANAKIKEAEDAKQAKEDAEAAEAAKTEFEELIADGDGKLGSEDFDAAIAAYTEALNTGFDNATANAKIKEAEDAKQAKEDAEAAEAAKTEFEELIADGDGKLGSEDFDAAIAAYTEALNTGFDDATANAKIQEAEDAKQAKQEKMDAAAKQEQFDELIADGDDKLGSEDFESAIANYAEALNLGVDDATANAKIKEAEDAKQAQQDADAAAAAKTEFEQLIAGGDGKLGSEDFDGAIAKYNEALNLGIDDATANAKIQEAEEAKDAKAAYEAKLAADNEEAAKEKEFNDLIAKGDAAKEAKDWAAAKEFYGQAKEVKNDSPIPQQKIDQVNEDMKVELEAEQNAQFEKYLTKGKEITEAGEYDKAIGLYNKAKGLFQGKQDILDEKIAEVKELKAKEDEYNKYMASADGLFESGKWKEAKTDYIKAKGVFDRPRPNEQIALIDQKIAEEEASLADQNALLEKYQEAIAKADAKRDEAISAKNKDLAQEAKGLYTVANDIMSNNDGYPQEQVNNLTNLMTAWEDEDSQKQYQKIIDKADELFAGKNWDGAEELYNRAIDLGLNLGDPYPPAQLEKIKNARANEGKLDSYNEFIKEGNAMFGDKEYQKAIAAYEGALGIKPGSKYPTDKIAEIKNLLAQANQAQKEIEQQEKAKKIDPNYMGDEVSMTEEEIKALWADVRVDEITDKDEDYDQYKEKVGDENMNDITSQVDRGGSINDTYEEMDQNIADQAVEWDQQRVYVLPEIEEYKEEKKNELADYYESETNRSNDLDDYYNDDEQERAEYELSLDDGRKDNIEDMEEYKLEQSDIQLDLADAELDLTYENNEYYEQYELERDQEFLDLDDPRKANVEDVHDYKEDQVAIENDRIDQGISSTYDIYDDYEEMEEEWEQFAEDGDIRRKEETVIQMDDFKELQMDIKLEDKAASIEKTDGVNDYNEEFHDYLDEFADEMDIPREDNVDAMEIYQDDRADLYQDDLFTNEERSQENYHDKDQVKEDQFNRVEEESGMVESNTEGMEAYKDKNSKDGVALKQGHDDDGFNNSQSIDSVKAQKATMFSDENVDPLAAQYPEGITEKTYQRTNNLGEVVEITIVRIVVVGNKADEYKKVTSKWNTAYFKNGGIINEYIWDTETN